VLFAQRGIDAVALRDVAAAADVHLTLIGRYVGNRDALVLAVFDDLSDQLARAVLEHPLESQGFEADTVMGRWVRIAGALAISGRHPPGRDGFNPVLAMADTIVDGYGQDPQAARLRPAQIVAAALGCPSRPTPTKETDMPMAARRMARRGVIGAPVARTAAVVGTAAVVSHGIGRRQDATTGGTAADPCHRTAAGCAPRRSPPGGSCS
jgi:AcrR family transcriptional regulator